MLIFPPLFVCLFAVCVLLEDRMVNLTTMGNRVEIPRLAIAVVPMAG